MQNLKEPGHNNRFDKCACDTAIKYTYISPQIDITSHISVWKFTNERPNLSRYDTHEWNNKFSLNSFPEDGHPT